jgi:hypothetical protein
VEHHAGLDVLLELTSVCVVDAQGAIVREIKVPTVREASTRSQHVDISLGGIPLISRGQSLP